MALSDSFFDGLGFIRNPLARFTSEHDDALARRHIADPAARAIVVAGDAHILKAVNGRPGERVEPLGATSLLLLDEAARIGTDEPPLFLGLHDGTPVIARRAGAEAAAAFPPEEGFFSIDLRSVAVQGLVPQGELGMLAQARSMMNWHASHGFCPRCGSPTVISSWGFRRDCANCGAQHFPRTDPVAIMLVARGDKCLLGRQARFVAFSYSCLAGFIEPGETIEAAVRRETFEESGIRVGRVRYIASQPWPCPASLMIGCLAEGLTEEIAMDRDELEDARWFSRDEVRAMLSRTHPDGLITPPPMAIAHHLIRAFAEGESPTG